MTGLISCQTKSLVNTLELSTSEISSSWDGLSIEIKINCNASWNIKNNTPEWININNRSGESGQSSISIIIAKNNSIESRSYLIEIISGDITRTIKITQEEYTLFNTQQKQYNINEFGGDITVNIESNNGLTPVIKNDCDWIKYSTTKSQISSSQFKFNISPLTGNIKRNSYIVFTNSRNEKVDSIEITQTTKEYENRKVLEKIYSSLDGTNWVNSTNWLSNKPINEWYGVETNGNDITVINLSANNLKGEIPKEICLLKQLTTLSLWVNNIGGQLPEDFALLTNLKTLLLGGNPISGDVPNSFYSLEKLEQLSINNTGINIDLNKITTNFPNLTLLSLDYIKLNTNIPQTIDLLSKLTFISLRNCGLTGNIPESIYNLSNLEYLALDNNTLTGEISNKISNLSRVQVLGLSDNNLSGPVPISIVKMNDLNNLMLSYNNLDSPLPYCLKNLKGWNNFDAENLIYPQKNGKKLTHTGYILGDIIKINGEVGVIYRLNDSRGLHNPDAVSSLNALAISAKEYNAKWGDNLTPLGCINQNFGLLNTLSMCDTLLVKNLSLSLFPALDLCLKINGISLSDANEYTLKWYIPSPGEMTDWWSAFDKINPSLTLIEAQTISKSGSYMSSYEPSNNECTSGSLSGNKLTDKRTTQTVRYIIKL